MSIPRGSKYPIIGYLGFWVIGITVQVLGKYMIIRYLDPWGLSSNYMLPQYRVRPLSTPCLSSPPTLNSEQTLYWKLGEGRALHVRKTEARLSLVWALGLGGPPHPVIVV